MYQNILCLLILSQSDPNYYTCDLKHVELFIRENTWNNRAKTKFSIAPQSQNFYLQYIDIQHFSIFQNSNLIIFSRENRKTNTNLPILA